MRPYTKTDRLLSLLLPPCAGVSLSFVMVAFVTEPNVFWTFHVAAIFMLPVCVHSRLRGRRRYMEIERAAAQRGWRIKKHHHLFFMNSEVEEIALIKGRFMADAIRDLDGGVERT